jgi:hypothetical protein
VVTKITHSERDSFLVRLSVSARAREVSGADQID